jgi:amino acid permease
MNSSANPKQSHTVVIVLLIVSMLVMAGVMTFTEFENWPYLLKVLFIGGFIAGVCYVGGEYVMKIPNEYWDPLCHQLGAKRTPDGIVMNAQHGRVFMRHMRFK